MSKAAAYLFSFTKETVKGALLLLRNVKYRKIINIPFIRTAQICQIWKDVEYQKTKENEANLSPDQILIFTEVITSFQALIFYLPEPIDCEINNGGCEETCIRGVNNSSDR